MKKLGFAARYGGYLETLPPKGKVKLQGSDALWVSVYVPEMGWCDPHNIISGERHIVTAYGRDYRYFPTKRNYF
jgi:hypothetical protein